MVGASRAKPVWPGFRGRRSRLVALEDETVLGPRADDDADDGHQEADEEEDAPPHST